MKGNIKKLALLMIITVIATFILAATVTADPRGHRAIRGQYAATGGSTCLLAICGFGGYWYPIGVPLNTTCWTVWSLSEEAVYTFRHDGTGIASGTASAVTLYNPDTGVSNPSPAYGLQTITFSFTYTVARDGALTISAKKDGYIVKWSFGPYLGLTYTYNPVTRAGTVSPDGKTILLHGGLPEISTVTPPPPDLPACSTQIVCNSSEVLIWLQDSEEE